MKLFTHQLEAINKVRGFKNVAFYLDKGLGKTFVSTEQMKIFNNKNNLVICQNSKKLVISNISKIFMIIRFLK